MSTRTYKYIFSYIPPEQHIKTAEDLVNDSNFFLFENPPSSEVIECLKRKALETWQSEEPYDWHPYNCFPLCTKDGDIIPDKFLPANVLIGTTIEEISFSGEKRVIKAHRDIHLFQEYITQQLNAILNDVMNTKEEKVRNKYLLQREFILQDKLNQRYALDNETPTQPYLYCVYRSNTTKPPSSDNFKIHLCPKPEYNFWTFFKMIQLTMKMPVEDFRVGNIKMCIPGRLINLTSEDTQVIKINGGSSPGVIMYIMFPRIMKDTNIIKAYNDACAKYLLQISNYFKAVEDAIGNITESIKLPFGNVRFNKLLCYASGTRANKLDILDGIQKKPEEIAKYNASEWIQQLCDTGKISTIEKYFMKNICGTPELNVMQLKDAPLPDPRIIESLEAESAGRGGGAGGFHGGYRRRKKSRKISRRKYKNRRTRKY